MKPVCTMYTTAKGQFVSRLPVAACM